MKNPVYGQILQHVEGINGNDTQVHICGGEWQPRRAADADCAGQEVATGAVRNRQPDLSMFL
jgi:hypothetical protein